MTGADMIREDFRSARNVLDDFCAIPGIWEKVQAAGDLMTETLIRGNKIFSCGNGGSHCDAMHFAEELSGRYRNDRPPLAALTISDASHITCVANDFGYEYIFSRYLEAVGVSGDTVVMFTSSGNSPSLITAAKAAAGRGIKVIGFTGKDGGALAPLCDIEVRVPHYGYADRIQEIHIKLVHSVIHHIEIRMGYGNVTD